MCVAMDVAVCVYVAMGVAVYVCSMGVAVCVCSDGRRVVCVAMDVVVCVAMDVAVCV